jgi:hypothetical protein
MPIVDLIKGMDFGAGVDLGGQLFGDAVVRTGPDEIKDTGGQTEDIFLTLVETQEDQNTALHLSTSVSASYGLFGGSGKFDLSEEMHVHNFSISLVIRATVLNTFKQMRDVQFGPQAKSLLENGKEARFREQFGDMFVRGIQTGGELCAILQIVGHDESDQTSIKADLEAGGIIGGVAIATKDTFSSAVSKATSHREVKLRHFQVGGTPKASIDPDTMIQHALNFAAEVKAGQSEAFQALLVPYKTLDAPSGPNFVDLESAKETLALLMQKRRDALTRLASFNFVIAHPDQFIIPPGTSVNAIAGRFGTAVAALTSAASRCVNNPKEAAEALTSIAALDVPVDDLPPRRAGDLGELDVLAAKGEAIANHDPLAILLRNKEPGLSRRGFDIGMAIAETDTLPGPGKDEKGKSLSAPEQVGFKNAVDFSVERNRRPDLARKGGAIAKVDQAVADERSKQPLGLAWLGFDIATGIFGDPKLGALGNTARGPGSQKIHDELLFPESRKGFEASVAFHLGRPK